MSTNQMLATKQETKTVITTEQSQKLMQTMLTMSFGCLAFLRGLFPDENFVDQRFVPAKSEKYYNKNLTSHVNSIKIKTLVRGKSTDVNLLLDWLEKGVFQSIKLEYLKTLSLGIYLNENDPTNLCENYIFNFEYFKDNSVQLKLDSNSNIENNFSQFNDDNNNTSISLLDSRKMAQQLMRRFIIITQSLEPLPQKKFLSMRLLFNDNVKDDYQPDFFKDASFDKRATLKIPIDTSLSTFAAGTLNTNHHNLKLNVYSTTFDDETLNDNELNTLKEEKKFMIIDPFEIDAETDTNILQQKVLHNSQSQTTNNLGKFLHSTQPTVEETQILMKDSMKNVSDMNSKNKINCDCNGFCHITATSIKHCKKCGKTLHGICYGNYYKEKVPTCFNCILGKSFDYSSNDFKDLMAARKCFRYLVRLQKIPTSISAIIDVLVVDEPITEEIKERFAFVFSLFLHDEIIIINDEPGHKSLSSSVRCRSASMSFDLPNIKSPFATVIDPNKTYFIKFVSNTDNAHSCYGDVIPENIKQVNHWLHEISELRDKIIDNLPDSCDITKLVVNDTDTQDMISIGGRKRKNLDLDEYLHDEQSSIINDILPSKFFPPKKFQKISVSKKSLKSDW
ncbi:similar to Saccharomyces cerevisiae YIL072W HOP1 Meiosis-specific DNA binding protein that displays Red1p dependent localization to the unsynapsed axial-lateral elements of the synaptonemal complex [Maudiozyma saulgeensis]|uniref:Similar to Saccharomyces cerevisiae YIL072W HOP1 Meiosis-specific DNA binding protein that displays Red1p dependent localization to the unsynapsed axial-lateral elements of the synaptonemal complex n=1 Tax=Maudiozyma saulgeensis TaxID=1789683 RepID=A0A1X7QYP7_9SACH|nr:similar to Saccharomyces cerevisiae YIL072W HOP1 Meiosis-specific DNA binding protein that displays Red1p dependent localization to the unsynapsed axial-lateral elements of the synaptonemal complex [Kazachstania saulgeensis]